MSRPCCPTCGQTVPAPKAVRALKAVPALDLASLSTAELYAHFKRTAVVEDLRFFLRGELSPALRARAESISKPTPKDLAALRTSWRGERQASELARGIPVIGSTAWNKAFDVDDTIAADMRLEVIA